MGTGAMITLIQLLIIIVIFVIFILVIMYFLAGKKKTVKVESDMISDTQTTQSNNGPREEFGKFQGVLTRESVYDFMEFDEVVDNMIVRKDRAQYVMVIQCSGVNYDLMSQPEKIGVEEGFVQFLNTLRFPVQLYIQSRTLNLKDIIAKYRERVTNLSDELRRLDLKINQAKMNGNKAMLEKLDFERRRKKSVLEYGQNITEYVERLSSNKNILQQKTYVVISYYSVELGGNVDNYSKEELNGMCFSELYTRAQNVISALGTSQVNCKILNSEELSELLYVAYNRDDSELFQISKMLDAQFDSLYSTGKDVLQKRQEKLDQEINIAAIDLTTDSILKADKRKKAEEEAIEKDKVQRIKEQALGLLGQYEDQLDPKVFEYATEEIENSAKNEEKKEEELKVENSPITKKVIRKRRSQI